MRDAPENHGREVDPEWHTDQASGRIEDCFCAGRKK